MNDTLENQEISVSISSILISIGRSMQLPTRKNYSSQHGILSGCFVEMGQSCNAHTCLEILMSLYFLVCHSRPDHVNTRKPVLRV